MVLDSEKQNKYPKGRKDLSLVLENSKGLVTIAVVAETLNLSRVKASKRLSQWAKQGLLKRVGPGTYLPVPLELLESPRILEDGWILVPELFLPGYVGGWTAAEHHGLTEQLFRETVVITSKSFRSKKQTIDGSRFLLKLVTPKKIFGTENVWSGQTKIPVSDIEKTIIDMLDTPFIGGGIQHVAECYKTYIKHPDKNLEKLITYAEQLGNGAVFKRLGYLSEQNPETETLAQACQTKLTQGNSKLDPAIDCPRLVTRWKLFIPETWNND